MSDILVPLFCFYGRNLLHTSPQEEEEEEGREGMERKGTIKEQEVWERKGRGAGERRRRKGL